MTRIIIFAKAPAAGFAKTRLIPALGIERTAMLATRMLHETARHALDARMGVVELCVTPAKNAVQWRATPLPAMLELTEQGEGDLGARMHRAACRALQQHAPIMFIGTDCPALDSAELKKAAHHLSKVDALLYPTSDGGYALLGLRRLHARMFEDIPWSTANVANVTLERIAELGWSVHVGPVLNDIDEPKDLQHVPKGWVTELP